MKDDSRIDGDTRSIKLIFKALKPHLSGTLWQLGDGEIEMWTEESLYYANRFAHELRGAMRHVAMALTGGTDVVDNIWIPPVLCTQRRLDALEEDTADLFLDAGGTTAVEIKAHPSGIYFCGFVYMTRPAARWSMVPLQGQRWDLVQIAFAWPFILISATGSRAHDRIVEIMNDRLAQQWPELALEPAAQALLDEAFIGEATQQTNLRGLHRSRKERPDRKTLYGLDLRHALDPFGDQTFAYTYGRAVLRLEELKKACRGNRDLQDLIDEAFPKAGKKKVTLGYGQPDHSIALSTTPGLIHFARRLDVVRLLLLETRKQLQLRADRAEPVWGDWLGLNYLSGRVATQDLASVADPFEAQLSVRSRDDAEGGILSADRERLEEWERQGTLVPGDVCHNADGTLSIEIEAQWDGSRLADLHVIARPDEEEIDMRVKLELADTSDPDRILAGQRLSRLLDDSKTHAVDLKFESGHVLSGGNLYKPTLREVLFTDWKFFPRYLNGRQYDIRKEKPKDWRYGATEDVERKIEESDSLFSQLALNAEHFFGADPQATDWALINNDQPEEIADFIFLDSTARRIDFVHVKKSDSDALTRRISTGPYEEVVPQAIKNLRHVDLGRLRDRFDDFMGRRANIGNFCVISDGRKPVIRRDTSAALACFERLAALGQPKTVKVICHAPHVLKSIWEAELAAGATTGGASRSAKMLSMLLLDAKARAASLNADFFVWSEEDPDALRPVGAP